MHISFICWTLSRSISVDYLILTQPVVMIRAYLFDRPIISSSDLRCMKLPNRARFSFDSLVSFVSEKIDDEFDFPLPLVFIAVGIISVIGSSLTWIEYLSSFSNPSARDRLQRSRLSQHLSHFLPRIGSDDRWQTKRDAHDLHSMQPSSTCEHILVRQKATVFGTHHSAVRWFWMERPNNARGSPVFVYYYWSMFIVLDPQHFEQSDIVRHCRRRFIWNRQRDNRCFFEQSDIVRRCRWRFVWNRQRDNRCFFNLKFCGYGTDIFLVGIEILNTGECQIKMVSFDRMTRQNFV